MGRFFATTAIAYVNDAPHVGHAYEVVLGDAICRWRRMWGDDVHYVTGTDEYGLKNQRAAEKAGTTPGALADLNSPRFRHAADALGVAYDDFTRTTDERHTRCVQRLLTRIHDRGFITRGTYTGWYCVACEAYYGQDELLEGNCPVHGRPVESMTETNWFFRLSEFGPRLLEWYEANPSAVMPISRRNEVISFVSGGLEDLSISRRNFSWGVPLPWEPSQVAWVWFDALPSYLTAAGYGQGDEDDDRFTRHWPADLHLIGKDIIRFHAVYWPAMLMAAGLEPPRRVAAHGFLLVGGEKMSKTRLNQISPLDLISDFGVDPLRYLLLKVAPFGSDGDLSHESMVARYNSDLANNLGNLVSRLATVVDRKCGGVGPAPDPSSKLAEAAGIALHSATEAWERLAVTDALDAGWALIHRTNAYLEANEPWRAEPGPDTDRVVGDGLEALRIAALLASPAMPTTAAEIWRRIGLDSNPASALLPGAAEWGGYPGGVAVVRSDPLFPRRKA
ncbi:MAG: methionine--tRNA ligase [Acidimicrobiales bacterium]